MRRLRRFVTSLGCAVALAGAGGCGDVSRSDGCFGDASLYISWSFGSEAPAIACPARGVDHLEVAVESGTCAGVVIAPVPCTLDRFRYDKQHPGPAIITVTAVDGADRIIASGSTSVTLGATVPAAPFPITLR